jgi:hypothetical protein
MTNPQTPVMFEFEGEDSKITTWNANEAVELFRDKHGLYLSIKAYDGPFIRLTKCHTARRFYHAQRDAQLKAQGLLSPEDQQPFCMASAIELGYNFPRNEYVLTCGGRTPQFATGAYIRNHIDSVMTEYKGFFPTGFDGHQDPHETTRLRELGVKRYQKAGES